MRKNPIIVLGENQLITVIRDLEMMVVSLDRIGSSLASKKDVDFNGAIARFVLGANVFRRLKKARKILSAPFHGKIGKDGMDDLERKLQNVKIWNAKLDRLSLDKMPCTS